MTAIQASSAWGQVAPPFWNDGETTFIVGGGPSLTGFDFRRLEGKGHILGVNQAIFDAPCDAGVSVDGGFIVKMHDALVDFAREHSLYLALSGDHAMSALRFVPGAVYLQTVSKVGLSFDPKQLHRGATSGYAALGVAILKRAKRVVLLGFDYGVLGGRHHYHDVYDNVGLHHRAQDMSWRIWHERYKDAAVECRNHGIEVINASLQSKLPYFPRVDIKDVV